MLPTITISPEDILHQVKLSCKIPSVVKEIVTRKIIASTAEGLGIKLEPEELQQAADKLRLISKLKTAEDTWAWLQKHSLSLDDFEEMVYTNILSEKLAAHLFTDHQYIQNTELRRSGGYRGIVRRKELKPEISAAVFAARPPQILKPIVTSKGVHLIWVEELVQPSLDDKLRYQILSELFSAWIKQQIEQVAVVTLLESNSQIAASGGITQSGSFS
jgi:hypothetical protein